MNQTEAAIRRARGAPAGAELGEGAPALRQAQGVLSSSKDASDGDRGAGGAKPPGLRMDRFAEFDPATLYEAAGRQGMVDPAIRPAWAGARVCGPALTVECPPSDNLMLHVAVADAEPGVVIVATVGGHLMAGAWGEILTEAARVRGIAGLVIDGAVRDIDAIEAARFPVFSRGLAIGSCTKEKAGVLQATMQFGGISVSPGDLVFGNADGLVVIAQDRLDDVYDLALSRRKKELEIIGKLREGRTTMELLDLTDPRQA
jgi:4-hydroxy-4-methyl-2-oxoglutarate aldolase